jgi:molecular chaperone GrpE
MSQDASKTPGTETSQKYESASVGAEATEFKEGQGFAGTEIEKLTQDLADTKDKYVRTVAEMENMRRRMERERGDLVKYALENILKDMLPTLDSLEKALPDSPDSKSSSSSEEGYYAGMLMVKKQLVEVLRKHGLEAIHAKGEAFDPNLHQAIQRVESSDVEKDLVGDEYARGYTLHGRLLRPAIVSVLSPAGS